VASNSLSWLDPKAIDSAKSLEWIAKSLAKGRLQGRHRSQRLSNGYEFSQFRPYVQGDDLRLIDWKMYGKTEKYYIKQSDVERDHNLHVILDNSKSMAYEEASWSKFLFAKLVAACISYITIQQGDAFSWSSHEVSYPSALGMRHWKNCIHAIHDINPESSTTKTQITPQKNKVYVWLTDLYLDIDEIKNVANSLKHNSTELIIFHLVGEQEENLDFPNNSTFIDLESEERLQMNPKEYIQEYGKKLGDHIKSCKQLFYSKGINYHKAYINHPIENTIKQFLDSYRKSLI